MQGVVETTNDDERNVDKNNLQNRNSRCRQILIEPEDERSYMVT